MLNFFEMAQLLEAKASDKTLWNYFRTIEKNPNLDDIKTLLTMMQQSYEGEDHTNMLTDFMPGIRQMIERLPEQEQAEAWRYLSGLRFHPETENWMKFNHYKKFTDVREFEQYVYDIMYKHSRYDKLSLLSRLIKDNEHLAQAFDDEFKQQIKRFAQEEYQKKLKEPTATFGDAMKAMFKQIKDQDDGKNWDGTES